METMGTHCMVSTKLVTHRLGQHFTKLYAEHGLKLELLLTYTDYKKKIADNSTIITWGVKLPAKWYYKKERLGKKFLYTENGLLNQKHGVYVDTEGWFGASSIKKEVGYVPTIKDMQMLREHVKATYRCELFEHFRQDGPIMFAVQYERDMGPRRFYKEDVSKTPFFTAMKRLFLEHGDDEVLIRPHPKFKKEFAQRWPVIRKGKHWQVDRSLDAYATLKTCNKLITINSTLLTEALALGLDVEAYGEGAWMCHDLTDEKSKTAYLVSVIRHQIPYKCSYEEFSANSVLKQWMEKLTN